MSIRTKYFLHRYHFQLILVVIVGTVAISFWFYTRGDDWKLFLPAIGGAVSLIYVVEKQQLDEASLFKDLFVQFNEKYDDLNEELNRIKSQDSISLQDCNTLYDYFNLCGEEYLFYQQGYIYPEVWQSWILGMKIFYDSDVIRPIWISELKSGSYYGLDIEREIKRINKRAL
jgi:hypothetical protein